MKKALASPRQFLTRSDDAIPRVQRLFRLISGMERTQKALILQGVEASAITLAFGFSLLSFHGLIQNLPGFALTVSWLGALLLSGGLSRALGLNHTRLIGYRAAEMLQSGLVAVAVAVAALVPPALVSQPMPIAFGILFGVLYLSLNIAMRISMRAAVVHLYETGQARKRVLIYGAGQTGLQLAAALATDHAVRPVCFVDSDPTLQSRSRRGLPVYAPERIPSLLRSGEIDRIVLAIPSVGRAERARIERSLRLMGAEVQTMPSFADFLEGRMEDAPLQHAGLETLMGREMIENQLPEVRDAYCAKRVLVTGAGGSIGSEICRQLLMCKPEVLVLLDHSELMLFEIERELADLRPETRLIPVLGSICEGDLVQDVLKRYQIDTVLHAAAYKHVPMVECNLIEGLRNNVLGTKVLADAAMAAGVQQFTLISSDKAVRPTSTMGASKRLAELVVQDLATRSTQTRFGMVRFGNVLGSSGSVVPLFREQIALGGPVTVTHPKVSRFFMTISEAVRLVLLAGSYAEHGDVLVLKMGDPVLIRDIARQMIEGPGLTVRNATNPQGDIEITYTGLRPGEKLKEELLLRSDMITTPHDKIMRSPENGLSELEIASALRDLRAVIRQRDESAAKSLLDRWIEGRNAPQAPQILPAE